MDMKRGDGLPDKIVINYIVDELLLVGPEGELLHLLVQLLVL